MCESVSVSVGDSSFWLFQSEMRLILWKSVKVDKQDVKLMLI